MIRAIQKTSYDNFTIVFKMGAFTTVKWGLNPCRKKATFTKRKKIVSSFIHDYAIIHIYWFSYFSRNKQEFNKIHKI
jgi:hypothetical protein